MPIVNRDFTYAHQDFQRYPQKTCPDPVWNPNGVCGEPVYSKTAVTGMVLDTLSDDGKPVCNPAYVSQSIENPTNQYLMNCSTFAQWFTDVPATGPVPCFSPEATEHLQSVNQTCNSGNIKIPGSVILVLKNETEGGGGIYDYLNYSFFPLNGKGFDDHITKSDWATNAGSMPWSQANNYLFTTEMKLNFTYQGGETFQFWGDDDVWVFVNGKLAQGGDLGGVHCGISGSVSLDAIAEDHNLAINGTYPLHLFHVERQSVASQFQVTTSLCIVDPCPEKCPDHLENNGPHPSFGMDPEECAAATQSNIAEHKLTGICGGTTIND